MSTVGVILITVGDTQYRGVYHDARGDIMCTVGCSVPWGEKSFVICVPHGTHNISPRIS